MNSLPSWLPETLTIEPWTNERFGELYEVFVQDFIYSRVNYRGSPVWFFPNRNDGKEDFFWHLTSREDSDTKIRLPDFRRCERLCWVRPMLENSGKPELLEWDYEEDDRTIRTYVWLKDFDFLVLMKKMKDGSRRFVTSYWIEYERKRKNLAKKYEDRCG